MSRVLTLKDATKLLSRTLGAWLLAIGLSCLAPADGLAEQSQTAAVIELFTSQGCSSCPPADDLVSILDTQRPDLIVLSFAVDYWDFLGWPDTLARSENSDRQRGYAIRRGDKAVYTPQIVVNGGPHLVGHDRAGLEGMVGSSPHTGPSLPINISLAATAQTIDVTLVPGRGGVGDMPTIWALLVSSEVEVSVGAGENRGRKIIYTNVVREMLPIGVYEGHAQTLRLPIRDLMGDGVDRIAVIVQEELDGIPGRILGGSLIDAPAVSAQR